MSTINPVNKIRVKGVYYDLIRQVENVDSSLISSMSDDSSLMKVYVDANNDNVYVASHSDVIKMAGENKTLTQQRKDDLVNFIEKLGSKGSTFAEVGMVYSGSFKAYPTGYDESTRTCKLYSSSSSLWTTYVFPIKKGVIMMHRSQITGESGYRKYFGFTNIEPTNDNLTELTYESVTRQWADDGNYCDIIVTAPYDGWMFFSRKNSVWSNNEISCLELSDLLADERMDAVRSEQSIAIDADGVLDTRSGKVGEVIKTTSFFHTKPINVEGHDKIYVFGIKSWSSANYSNVGGNVFYSDEDGTQAITTGYYRIPYSDNYVLDYIEMDIPKGAKSLRVTLNHTNFTSGKTTYYFVDNLSVKEYVTELSGRITDEKVGLLEEIDALGEQREFFYKNLTEKLGESGSLASLGFDYTIYEGYYPIYNKEANTLTFEANTDTKYRVYVMPIKKGVVYRRTAQSTVNRTVYIAYTTTEITSGDDLLATTFDNVTREAATTVFDTISIAPYDGYMLIYLYNQKWTNPIISYKFDLSDYSNVRSFFARFFTPESVDFDSLSRNLGWINRETNKWYLKSTASTKFVLISLKGVIRVSMKALSNEYGSYIAWLTDTEPVNGQDVDYANGTSLIHLEADEEYESVVPDNASYLYVYAGTSGYSVPQNLILYTAAVSDTGSDIAIKKGWEKPDSMELQNVLKKALQMVKLKFTVKGDYPLKVASGDQGSSNNYIPAGTLWTKGIPYSNNISRWKRVGLEVSIHTFMTAINNPYSLCYTENVDDVYHSSIWGEDYYSTNGNGYYGTMCCGFTAAVHGLPFNIGNPTHYETSRTLGIMKFLHHGLDDNNIDYLRIGDVGDDDSHSGLVYGIHRDAQGKVDRIQWAESTSAGGYCGCRIVEYERNAFMNYINRHGHGMDMYRFRTIEDNIDYEPSIYVPLIEYGETEEEFEYNNDICTFAGDKATFMQGNLVVVNYNLDGEHGGSWDRILLYKDGSSTPIQQYILSEIDQSNLPSGQQNHALNLGYDLAAGKYKACMSNETQDTTSDFTYFEVLTDVVVTVKGDDTYEVKITDGTNGEISYVMCGRMHSTIEHYAYHGFWHNNVCIPADVYEKHENMMTIHPREFRTQYGYELEDTTHIVVMVKGEYGIAGTMPIELSSLT